MALPEQPQYPPATKITLDPRAVNELLSKKTPVDIDNSFSLLSGEGSSHGDLLAVTLEDFL